MTTNILVPMLGKGQRYRDGGFDAPKQLIQVGNKQLIDWSLQCIDYTDSHLIFIIREDSVSTHNMDKILKEKFGENIELIISGEDTDGTLSTCMLAKNIINNDTPLTITTLDVYFRPYFNPKNNFNADGVLPTLPGNNPAYSYSKINSEGLVIEVAEKKIISNIANAGLYYFAKGTDFVEAGETTISKNMRVNNEFYVAPVYNELIKQGKKIINYPLDNWWQMGTPEQRTYFLENDYASLQNK